MYVKELAQSSRGTLAATLTNFVSHAAEEVSDVRAMLNQSMRMIQQLQIEKANSVKLAEHELCEQQQMLREKQEAAEKMAVELAIFRGEVETLNEKMKFEKRLTQSALNNCQVTKTKMTNQTQKLEAKVRKLERENRELFESSMLLKSKANNDVTPVAELEFELERSRKKMQAEMTSKSVIAKELSDTKSILKKTWKSKQKLQLIIERKNKHEVHFERKITVKENARRELLRQLNESQALLKQQESYYERLVGDAEERAELADQRLKDEESKYADRLVELEQKSRARDSKQIEKQLEAFSVQLREQLAASQTAYTDLQKRVKSDYISIHEHHRQVNKLESIFQEEEKKREKARAEEVVELTERIYKKQQALEVDAKIKLDAEIEDIKDDVHRDSSKMQREIDLMRSKLDLVQTEKQALSMRLHERTQDMAALQKALDEEKRKADRLESDATLADQAVWRLSTYVQNGQVLLNQEGAKTKSRMEEVAEMKRKNNELKEQLDNSRLEIEKVIISQQLAHKRQEDKTSAAHHLETALDESRAKADQFRFERDSVRQDLMQLQKKSKESIRLLNGKISEQKLRLIQAKTIGEEFAVKLRESRHVLKEQKMHVADYKGKVESLKDQIADYRELTERLTVEVRDLRHRESIEKAKRQPSLRYTSSSPHRLTEAYKEVEPTKPDWDGRYL